MTQTENEAMEKARQMWKNDVGDKSGIGLFWTLVLFFSCPIATLILVHFLK